MSHGVLYTDATSSPLSPHTSRVRLLPSAYYVFYITGTTTPATVYQDGNLLVPYTSNVITANSSGVFAAVFLDPAQVYRYQLFDQYNRLLQDVDPYIASLTTFGINQLRVITLTGQVAINPTSPGGAGAALTLVARPGGIALSTGVGTPAPGVSEVYLLFTDLTGTQTATFSATNKPGTGTSGATAWLPLHANGTQHYIPLWT